VLAGYRLADWLAGVNFAATNGTPPPTQAIIGNRKSHIYHVSGCKAYDKVSQANRIYFQSEAEAQQAGYRKAGNCP
jgi:deoxyribonuclease I